MSPQSIILHSLLMPLTRSQSSKHLLSLRRIHFPERSCLVPLTLSNSMWLTTRNAKHHQAAISSNNNVKIQLKSLKWHLQRRALGFWIGNLMLWRESCAAILSVVGAAVVSIFEIKKFLDTLTNLYPCGGKLMFSSFQATSTQLHFHFKMVVI